LKTETDLYRTIEKNSEGIFKDKGSKFLAFAFPVQTEEQIKIHINELKKKYFDARHHCYAYRICPEKPRYRANDDGEPSGTAGKPIYGQILSNNLFDVLIVVVRYFGGTLLGTSGLINAYRAGAADCIANTRIIERNIEKKLTIFFGYDKMNQVMKVIKEENMHIILQQSDMECTFFLNIGKSKLENALNRLLKIEHLKYELENE
jgi:uncharacterized YigZ family protein